MSSTLIGQTSTVISVNIENGKLLNIYPNPTSNSFNVLLKGNDVNVAETFKIEVRNTLGQILISKTINLNSVQEINSSELMNGLYLVSLTQGNKLIKETKLVIVK